MQLRHYMKSEICNTLTLPQNTENKICSFLLLRYFQHLSAFESQALSFLAFTQSCPVFSVADNSRASLGDSGHVNLVLSSDEGRMQRNLPRFPACVF